MTLKFNNTFEYKLPPYMDAEGNAIIMLLTGFPPISAFMTLQNQEKIIIKPTLWSQLGSYKLNITFSDTQKTNSYFFNVTIVNTAPYFSSGIKPSNQRFRLGTPFNYTLPDCQDENFNPIYVIQTSTKNFVTVKGLTYFFNTRSPDSQLGFFRLKFDLTDLHLSTPYDLKIEVFNEAPYFLEPLADQFVYIGKELIYQFPEAEDAEFLPIKITANLLSNSGASASALPAFIKLQGKSLAIKPTELKHQGQYKLEISLDDGYAQPNKYKMRVTVDVDPNAEDKHKGF